MTEEPVTEEERGPLYDTLVAAGYTADSVAEALAADDVSLLRHTCPDVVHLRPDGRPV